MTQWKRVLTGAVVASGLGVFSGGTALAQEPSEKASEDTSPEAMATTHVLTCNLASSIGLSNDPRTYRIDPKAGVGQYILKFTTQSGTIAGRRPGVQGDGAFGGANFTFAPNMNESTVYVSPGTGRMWKRNVAGEGSFTIWMRLICQ